MVLDPATEKAPFHLLNTSMRRAIWPLLLWLTFQATPGEATVKNHFVITLSNAVIQQGDSLTIFVDTGIRLKRIEITCFEQRLLVYRVWYRNHEHLFRGFCGVPVDAAPGHHTVTAIATDENDQEMKIHAGFRVQKVDFAVQHIRLPVGKQDLNQAAALRAESAKIGAALKHTGRKVYFATDFIWPAEGRISSPFGVKRRYNDGVSGTYHKGVDIANPIGTPVVATNGGQVSLAEHFRSHGKTIIIDHGHGISSIYCHLDQLMVEEGQWVKRGEQIGTIGDTGIATGPHLHFGFSVNDVRVEPLSWIDGRIHLFYGGLE
jgi:murein DD-endopeptidase MepM/ murein hydrolase activator NlpD